MRLLHSRWPANPPLEGDLPEMREGADVPAAVLMAITDRERPGLILTVRREHLRTHAGQIALPGGRSIRAKTRWPQPCGKRTRSFSSIRPV